jgi:hypothetical protein
MSAIMDLLRYLVSGNPFNRMAVMLFYQLDTSDSLF